MTTPIHPRLVAAVRWDYEVGLLSRAEVVRKYRLVLGADSAYRILRGDLHPEVKAAQHKLAWCKTSWRKIR